MVHFGKNKRKLLALLFKKHLADNDEDDEIMQISYVKRKTVSKVFLKRQVEGAFNNLINNNLLDEEEKFIIYFRVTREQFTSILSDIVDDLHTYPCNRVRAPISPSEKLAVTLRFLATGESHRSLSFSFRISPSALCKIIPQVLKAMKEKLVKKFLPEHDQIDWKQKTDEFFNRWDFPNCVSAIDGKHVRIVAPDNSGALYHNYKGYYSVVLLAMVDANCKFLLIDVGSYGKEGDSGIFKKSRIYQLVKNEAIFPPPAILPESNIILPHVLLGDEAFALSEHMMKPFCRKQAVNDPSKQEFNAHLSRARRVTENAFGIMCCTFRIFFTPINLKPETVDLVIIVCYCLHNMLRKEYFSAHSFINAEEPMENLELPTNNMIPLIGRGGFDKSAGFQVRSRFMDYFNMK